MAFGIFSILLVLSLIISIEKSNCVERKTQATEELFIPSISINSSLLSENGISLDMEDATTEALNNVIYNFTNASNFNMQITLFITVNGVPIPYSVDNAQYKAEDGLCSIQVMSGFTWQTSLNLSDSVTDFEYTENYLDVVAMIKGIDLPDNSLTHNINLACDSKYIIMNPNGAEDNSSLLDRFSSESLQFDIEFDSNNTYCFLNSQLSQDELYQPSYLSEKFYGVFSNYSDEENQCVFIFENNRLADIDSNCIFLKYNEEEPIIRQFVMNGYQGGEIYCIKIPIICNESTMQYFNTSEIINEIKNNF